MPRKLTDDAVQIIMVKVLQPMMENENLSKFWQILSQAVDRLERGSISSLRDLEKAIVRELGHVSSAPCMQPTFLTRFQWYSNRGSAQLLRISIFASNFCNTAVICGTYLVMTIFTGRMTNLITKATFPMQCTK